MNYEEDVRLFDVGRIDLRALQALDAQSCHHTYVVGLRCTARRQVDISTLTHAKGKDTFYSDDYEKNNSYTLIILKRKIGYNEINYHPTITNNSSKKV